MPQRARPIFGLVMVAVLAIVGSGCASYYGGTSNESPILVAEHGAVVPLYRLSIWQEPSFPDIFGRPVLSALVHEPKTSLTSAELKQLLSSIPDEYVLERSDGELTTARTLRDHVAKATSNEVAWDMRWVLSIEPLVIAITAYSPDAWYERDPTWARFSNPPMRFVEEQVKSVQVTRYVIVRNREPVTIMLHEERSLGALLESQPWNDM